jgi:putative spermidine/putrescine transport system substrate-binding protein
LTSSESRRSALKYGVAAVVAVVVAGVGGYAAWQATRPPAPAPTPTPTPTPTPVPKPDFITLLAWGDPKSRAAFEYINEMFEAEFGIPVRYEVEAYSTEGLAKIRADLPNYFNDVWGATHVAGLEAAIDNIIAPFPVEEMPNLEEIPDEYMTVYNGKIYGVANFMSHVRTLYRTDLVDEPVSMEDLADPQYRIGIVPIGYYGGVTLLRLAYAMGGDEYNPEPGWELLKKIAPNITLITPTVGDIISSIERGEINVHLGSTNDSLLPLLERGVAVAFAAASEKHPVHLGEWTLHVTNSPRKEWAFKYVNLALDREINEESAARLGQFPTNINAEAAAYPYALTKEEIEKYAYAYDPLVAREKMEEWTARFDEEIRPLLGVKG